MTDDQKFGLLEAEANHDFNMGGDKLDFATHSPENFQWREMNEAVHDFDATEMFSSFTLRWIGYEPVNRDKMEIRLYSAMLNPNRVAVAADYARLCGRVWKTELSFGTQSDTLDFGEVVAGDDSSGEMIVTRYSIFRRGDELLVIRTTFEAQSFTSYNNAIASFVGSVTFDQPLGRDPITDALVSHTIAIPDGKPLAFRLPASWEQPNGNMQGSLNNTTAQIYVDTSDPGRNLGILIVSTVAPNIDGLDAKSTGSDSYLPQKLEKASEGVAQVMFENLMPKVTVSLDMLSQGAVDDLGVVTLADKRYQFKASLKNQGKEAGVSVLLTIGAQSTVIATSSVSPYPVSLHDIGTGMHGTFVDFVVQQDITKYWQDVAATLKQ